MISLKRGSIVKYDGKEYEILNLIGIDKILISDKEQNLKTILVGEIDQLQESEGTLENASIDVIDPKTYEYAQERFEIIKPLLRTDRSKKDVEEVAAKSGKSMVTIYSWIKKFENSGTVLSLLPGYKKRGGKNKSRMDPRVEHIMESIIEDKYLTKQKMTIQKVYEELSIILKSEGLPIPTYHTLRNRILKIDDATIMKKRLGRSAFMNNYQPSPDSFEPKYPFDVIQIDHTPLDIQVLDEIHRKPIGRPYLTIAIDVFSRMIYGLCLTLDNPNYYGVGQTIFLGMSDKEKYLEHLGVEGEWEIAGIPASLTIHTDNAAEFRGNNLKRLCETLKINMEFRPIGAPHYGGHVERVIKTINTQIHSLPGTTFSNVQDRGEYESEKQAVFTLVELEKWLVDWIVNVYHQKIHTTLGMSPLQRFKQGILGDDERPGMGLPPRLTYDELEFARLSLLPAEHRTVQKDGIAIFGIKYYSDILRSYIKSEVLTKDFSQENNGKYIVKYDPKDMSKVFFYDPVLKEYFEIPYRNMSLPSVSLWDIQNAKKYLKEKNIRNIDDVKIFEAIERLNRRKNESIEKSKKARRRKQVDNSKTNFDKAQEKPKQNKEKSISINIDDIDDLDVDFS